MQKIVCAKSELHIVKNHLELVFEDCTHYIVYTYVFVCMYMYLCICYYAYIPPYRYLKVWSKNILVVVSSVLNNMYVNKCISLFQSGFCTHGNRPGRSTSASRRTGGGEAGDERFWWGGDGGVGRWVGGWREREEAARKKRRPQRNPDKNTCDLTTYPWSHWRLLPLWPTTSLLIVIVIRSGTKIRH
jgi:hypothetical protein